MGLAEGLNRPVLERVLTLDFLAAPENVLLAGAQGGP